MTEKITEWNKDQNDLTRDVLERIDIVAFTFDCSGQNKGCILNQVDGRYGYIILKDALANKWDIYDYDTDELTGSYKTIDGIIENGWKVST